MSFNSLPMFNIKFSFVQIRENPRPFVSGYGVAAKKKLKRDNVPLHLPVMASNRSANIEFFYCSATGSNIFIRSK